MISKIMKKFLVVVVAIIAVFSVSAQGKYGTDEQKCKENLSMYREYYKQKNYDDAYKPWRWAYANCPQSSGNIFKNAPKILKAKMKADKENKSGFFGPLMLRSFWFNWLILPIAFFIAKDTFLLIFLLF